MCKPIVLFILLFSGVHLFAQTNVQVNDSIKETKNVKMHNKITFGVKLSPSVSWIAVVNNDAHSDGAALNYGVGGIVSYNVLPNLSLVSGLNFNVFGGYVYDK